eukprot:5786398-Pleurochrysis_carterae.AAC.3
MKEAHARAPTLRRSRCKRTHRHNAGSAAANTAYSTSRAATSWTHNFQRRQSAAAESRETESLSHGKTPARMPIQSQPPSSPPRSPTTQTACMGGRGPAAWMRGSVRARECVLARACTRVCVGERVRSLPSDASLRA